MTYHKKSLWGLWWFLVIGMVLWSKAGHAANIDNKLINFQGYLTNNATPPNPLNDAYKLTFRIYRKASDLEAVWVEVHENVSIIAGNVSVLLGSIVPMPLTFDEPHYLGIQVREDAELIPRQRLLPAFQATVASKLVVHHPNQARSEFGVNHIIPVGGIIAYFGDPQALPENWKVCDGSEVTDPESPFRGKHLPNLANQFVRGEADTTRNTMESLHTGGAESHSHGYGIPAHDHSIADDLHSHSIGDTGAPQDVFGEDVEGMFFHSGRVSVISHIENLNLIIYKRDVATAEHIHTVWGASSHGHNHGGKTGSNESLNPTTETVSHLPSYVALHYIIRIK